MKPSSLFRSLSLSLLILLGHSTLLFGQGTAFTYQGRLNNNGLHANGSYDLQFSLFPTNATGAPLAGPVTNLAVPVSNGLFTATVDFGNAFAGTSNWLELAVSTNAANTFSTLTPRQLLLPIPYAIFANSASNLLGNLPTAQLSGPIPITNITGILPLAQLPPGVLTNTQTSVTLSGAFAGDGSGLTNSTPLAALGPNSVPGSNAVAAMIVALAPVGPGGSASNAIAINNGVGNNTTFNPNSGSGNVALTVNGTQVFGVTTNQPMLIAQIGYETNLNGTAFEINSAGNYFNNVYDPIVNWGFNVGPGGGVAVAGQQAWYHQDEYNYFVGNGIGLIFMEDHQDAWTTNVAIGYRPVQIDVDINPLHLGTNDYQDYNSYLFSYGLPFTNVVYSQLSPTSWFLDNPSQTEGFNVTLNGAGQVYLNPVNKPSNQDLVVGNGTGNYSWHSFSINTKTYGNLSLGNAGLVYNALAGGGQVENIGGGGFLSSGNTANYGQMAALELDNTSGNSTARNWKFFNPGSFLGAWDDGSLYLTRSSTAGGDTRPVNGGFNYMEFSTNTLIVNVPLVVTNGGFNSITTGTINATNFTGNGGGLTHLNAAQISGTLPVVTLPGLTTNVSTGGITFHITNGLIMRVTSP